MWIGTNSVIWKIPFQQKGLAGRGDHQVDPCSRDISSILGAYKLCAVNSSLPGQNPALHLLPKSDMSTNSVRHPKAAVV
jgi:hypothetical protein